MQLQNAGIREIYFGIDGSGRGQGRNERADRGIHDRENAFVIMLKQGVRFARVLGQAIEIRERVQTANHGGIQKRSLWIVDEAADPADVGQRAHAESAVESLQRVVRQIDPAPIAHLLQCGGGNGRRNGEDDCAFVVGLQSVGCASGVGEAGAAYLEFQIARPRFGEEFDGEFALRVGHIRTETAIVRVGVDAGDDVAGERLMGVLALQAKQRNALG